MTSKTLKYFMRKSEEEIVTAPAPDSFVDENGKVLELRIKCLSQNTIDKINDSYKTRQIAMDKKGRPLISGSEVVWKTDKDSERAVRHIIAEALVYPNLKDEELMKFYNCYDFTEMPRLVFSKPGEYNHVVRMVLAALGISDDENVVMGSDKDDNEKSEVESDIDDAKN